MAAVILTLIQDSYGSHCRDIQTSLQLNTKNVSISMLTDTFRSCMSITAMAKPKLIKGGHRISHYFLDSNSGFQ